MRIYIVVASINELGNFKVIRDSKYDLNVIVIDEGDELVRDKNKRLLSGLPVNFYGPHERSEWFKRMGDTKEVFASVIPEKCHAETSFGFLIAWEESADVVIEVDDDVKFTDDHPFIDGHVNNLYNKEGLTVFSKSKWYNTLKNLKLNTNMPVFPRGHPYDVATRTQYYELSNESSECVLNMGVWTGYPDFDALTILYNGGLDGRCHIKSTSIEEEKVIVGKGTYFSVCSMNTSFRRKVIPAFYQLYMRYLDIDRFDDIWSGIFIKKIADHLGDKISLGIPIVYHDKRPRNIWNDLRVEIEGMIINENLWRIIDAIELTGNDYYETYSELVEGLDKSVDIFQYKNHRDFMRKQIEKMKLWLKLIDSYK